MYDTVVADDCDGVTEDGEVIFKLRTNVLPASICEQAYRALRTLHAPPTNRFTGTIGESKRPIRKDGRRSNSHRISLREHPEVSKVSSAIIGFYDRYIRFPYCRATAFNLNEPAKFQEALPFVRGVDAVFRREMPERWEAQMAFVRRTHPDFYIHGTSFTTITVNKNWPTRVHLDEGDLPQGFGVMSCFRAGQYDGGFLCFPRYRVAIDMRTRGVLMANVHEWHGNAPIVGVEGRYERVSCVFYYRSKMVECGSAKDELRRAKYRKRGDPLWETKPL